MIFIKCKDFRGYCGFVKIDWWCGFLWERLFFMNYVPIDFKGDFSSIYLQDLFSVYLSFLDCNLTFKECVDPLLLLIVEANWRLGLYFDVFSVAFMENWLKVVMKLWYRFWITLWNLLIIAWLCWLRWISSWRSS